MPKRSLAAILSIPLLALGLWIAGFEMPGPRYSEAMDFPSVVAERASVLLSQDPTFQSQKPIVLRAWNWRWGRYCATIQVWGIQNVSQRAAASRVLHQVSDELGHARYIQAEYRAGRPDSAPFGSKLGDEVIR